jgi:hypothetical protein
MKNALIRESYYVVRTGLVLLWHSTGSIQMEGKITSGYKFHACSIM